MCSSDLLASRSNLDIGLTTISRYRDTDGRHVLVPQHVVRSSGRAQGASPSEDRQMSAELTSVVDAYNAGASAGLEAVGQARRYRQIRPVGWPGGLHYEFLQYSDSIGVELHLESPACNSVADVVEALSRKAGAPYQLDWSANWQRGPGRLLHRISSSNSPDMFATAMKDLITFSFDDVNHALRQRRQVDPAQQGGEIGRAHV